MFIQTITATGTVSSTTTRCPCCGHALGNTPANHGLSVVRNDFAPQLDHWPTDKELELLTEREALLEHNRRAYRALVRDKASELQPELRPAMIVRARPSPPRRRRARAEPIGLRNYRRACYR